MNELTRDQQELSDLISDISNEAWQAGWVTGCEYRIWDCVFGGKSQLVPSHAMTAERQDRIRELSRKIDGWIYWRDDTNCPGLDDPCEWGPVFVSPYMWQQMRKQSGSHCRATNNLIG